MNATHSSMRSVASTLVATAVVVTGFVLAGHARTCGRIRAGRCS